MATKLFFKNRSFWLAFGLSAIFVIVSYINNTVPRWLSSLSILELILNTIQFPALMVAILIGSSHRDPNVFAFYVTLFITYLVIFGGIIRLVEHVTKRMLKKGET